MRLKRSFVVVLALGVAAPLFAQPPGRGRPRVETTEEHIKRRSHEVANEAVDAVAEEVTGQSTPSGMPPGLAKKGALPPGLAKKNKVPPGWSKGRKEGWGDGQKASPLRTLIRRIFRKPAPPAAPAQ